MLQKKTTLILLSIFFLFAAIEDLHGVTLTANIDASKEIEKLEQIVNTIQKTASDGEETLKNATKEINENIRSTGTSVINGINCGTDKISAEVEKLNYFINTWSVHLRRKLPIQIASTIAIIFGLYLVKNGLESKKNDDRYISPEWSIAAGATLSTAGGIALVWTCYED